MGRKGRTPWDSGNHGSRQSPRYESLQRKIHSNKDQKDLGKDRNHAIDKGLEKIWHKVKQMRTDLDRVQRELDRPGEGNAINVSQTGDPLDRGGGSVSPIEDLPGRSGAGDQSFPKTAAQSHGSETSTKTLKGQIQEEFHTQCLCSTTTIALSSSMADQGNHKNKATMNSKEEVASNGGGGSGTRMLLRGDSSCSSDGLVDMNRTIWSRRALPSRCSGTVTLAVSICCI